MENVWQLVLRQLASADPTFTHDDVCGWSAEEFEALTAAGLIGETVQATHVVCDVCPEAHWEPVRWSEDGKRAFIPCSAAGLVDIDLERLRRWRIDVARLAILLADALELRPESTPLARGGGLWRLGRSRFGGQFRDFFFAVIPEGELPAAIRAADQSLVSGNGLLILPQPEIDAVGKPARLKVAALSDIASWQKGKIVTDLDFIEDIFTRDDPVDRVLGVRSLPIPDNAKWDELVIDVLDTELKIEVAGYATQISFEEAGCSERDQRLETLKLLAASRGRFASDQVKPLLTGKTPLKNRVNNLRQFLQALLPIDGNPIEHHKRAGAYVCKFQIRLADAGFFPTPSGVSWLDFRFAEREDGRLAVSVAEKRIFRAAQAERGSGRLVEEVGQRDEIVPRLYSLEDLKLRNAKGKLTPEGTALIDLLRGGGRLERRGDNTAVLKLGRWLQAWTSLESEPLRYSESTRSWAAAFECSSEHGR